MKQQYFRRISIFISALLFPLFILSHTGSIIAQDENPLGEPPPIAGDPGQPQPVSGALHFNGLDQYVTFGPAPQLGANEFTLELWFKWEGNGATVNTGVDGVEAYPLLTKGRTEGDHSPSDMNYFLGIRGSDQVLVADLEEGAEGVTPGQNHPIIGITPLVEGEWYHGAATYDGRQWQLFLNGKLEAEIVVDQPVRSDSIQHAALATALNSKGMPAGYFGGAVDEVRIWNKALNEQEIRANINTQLAKPQPNLLARWGFDEVIEANVLDSSANSVTGALATENVSQIPGTPFNLALQDAPNAPVLVQPGNSAIDVSTSPTLEVMVTDPEADSMTVTFYGRPVTSSNPDFTLVAMPDTQKYAEDFDSRFTAQTQWVVDNKDTLNIAHVMQLGDCVENANVIDEWEFADEAFGLMEDETTTGLTDGISYSIAVGNHDQYPADDPNGASTENYNDYFGISRFNGRRYFGGYYGSNFDNHFELFSAGGMDFIIISLEYEGTPAVVLEWLEGVLDTYSNRRAIIVTHYFIRTGNPGPWGSQGEDIYEAVKDKPNVFLFHGGHRPGEGQRVDTFEGNTIHTLLADYQGRPNNGDGWLRILEFSPNNDEIRVKTYSPTRDEFETDSDSQFTFSYDMPGAPEFQELGQVNGVASGANAALAWPNLDMSTEYEWYVTVDDGSDTIEGPTWSFTTGSNLDPHVPSNPLPDDGTAGNSTTTNLSWTGGDPDGDPVTYDVYLDTTNPPTLLQSGLTNASFDPGTLTAEEDYYWQIVAHDDRGGTTEGPVWHFSTVIPTGSVITQSVPMGPGWKLFSSYVLPDNLNIAAIFEDVEDEVIIIKNGAGDVYWPDMGITDIVWDSCHGYHANLKSTIELEIGGGQIVPEQMNCVLDGGWNVISYLRDSSMSVATAVASCSSETVMIKNGLGLIYWPAYGVDQIVTMNPGEGYELFLSAPCTLIYPANDPP